MSSTIDERGRALWRWLSAGRWRMIAGGAVAATALGLLSSLALKAGLAAAGQGIGWRRAFAGFLDWHLWLLLAPVIVRLARSFPLTHDRWPLSLAAHAVLGVAIALMELALFTLVSAWYNAAVLGTPYPDLATAYLGILARWLPSALVIYALIVAVVTAVDHGRRVRERERRAATLENELTRAQIQALQAQIEPHFLFNTLNTISVLVREGRQGAAVGAMADLGRILRRSMAPERQLETTLERETGFTRDYLRLEKHRLEERLDYEFRLDPGTLRARVPTLILQPLVENAIRHGIQDRPGGGRVTVAASRRNGVLELTVRNTGAPLPGGTEEGVGLANLRARLRAHYGEEGELRLESDGKAVVRAVVRLPFRFSAGSGG